MIAGAPNTPLSNMQSNIADLYETPIDFSVEDFLITDLARIGGLRDAQEVASDEMLFVLETHDGMDISLFLDENVVNRLNDCDPEKPLGFKELSNYLMALEGVSHFQYLIWNAERQKSVTLFELELQAEVDKYILASMILAKQGNGNIPKDLYGYLFDAARFRSELKPNVASRYRDANHYAGKYCRTLKSEFPDQHRQKDFITEVRRFYRLPQNEKVRRIEAASH